MIHLTKTVKSKKLFSYLYKSFFSSPFCLFTMSIILESSNAFLKDYLNNASPTGFESEGQKLWLKYIEPFVDESFIDNYGTAY